jgi:cytoskeletal protein CcmA (bactofilin family)
MSPRDREPDPKPKPKPEPKPWPEPQHTPVRSVYPGTEGGLQTLERENVVILGPRDRLHGRLEIQGDLLIEGNVEGELKASGDISIEPTASIQGSVEGANVRVRGQVYGNVTARRGLIIGGTGRLNGEVRVTRLTIEDGATLNGTVTMMRT